MRRHVVVAAAASGPTDSGSRLVRRAPAGRGCDGGACSTARWAPVSGDATTGAAFAFTPSSTAANGSPGLLSMWPWWARTAATSRARPALKRGRRRCAGVGSVGRRRALRWVCIRPLRARRRRIGARDGCDGCRSRSPGPPRRAAHACQGMTLENSREGPCRRAAARHRHRPEVGPVRLDAGSQDALGGAYDGSPTAMALGAGRLEPCRGVLAAVGRSPAPPSPASGPHTVCIEQLRHDAWVAGNMPASRLVSGFDDLTPSPTSRLRYSFANGFPDGSRVIESSLVSTAWGRSAEARK
jgi:hypothetical protein